MLIEQLTFYFFAALAVLSAVLVIGLRNPVQSALALVMTFFAAAVLWLLLEAEFLALVLIFVYVGAVMTLFLFVVMMLNIDELPSREGFVRYLPFALVVIALMVALMILVIGPKHFGASQMMIPAHQGVDYSNAKELGSVLYTHYVYAFELAAVLLLVSIIAAISLSFRGRRQNTRGQRINQQIAVKREDRVRIVKMPSEKKIDPKGDYQ